MDNKHKDGDVVAITYFSYEEPLCEVIGVVAPGGYLNVIGGTVPIDPSQIYAAQVNPCPPDPVEVVTQPPTNENIQVVLTIPKEFAGHFEQDRFYDSLMRLNSDAHLLAGNYEQETAKMLIGAFKDCKVLPKGHGDLKDADAIREIIKANQYLLSAKHNSTDYGMFTTGIMQAIDSVEPVVSADNPSPDIDVGRMM